MPGLVDGVIPAMELEILTDGCGVIDLKMKTISGPTPLEDGKYVGGPIEDRKNLMVGIPVGWKNALVGTNAVRDSIGDPKIAHSANAPVISLSDTLVDSVTSGLKLCVVSRFFSFRPIIEMVWKWVGQKWRIKGSVGISTMPSDLFCFKFMVEEDIKKKLLGTWYYGKHFLSLTRWHLGFDSSVELNRIGSIWVRLLELPLEF